MSAPESRDSGRVRDLFGAVAPRYDLLNRLLSFRLDRGWRRAAARELLPEPSEGPLLDLCGGTGDLTIEMARAGGARVVCCDFAHAMLRRAEVKLRRAGLSSRCVVLEGDGLRLPFRDGSFPAAGVAFGVRNFENMDAGFAEILRVLAPGGRLVVLEFSRPTGPVLSRLHRFYLHRVLPRAGDAVSGNRGPYGYLASTIEDFPEPSVFAGLIRQAGFAAVGWRTLSGGIVALHTAVKALRDRATPRP